MTSTKGLLTENSFTEDTTGTDYSTPCVAQPQQPHYDPQELKDSHRRTDCSMEPMRRHETAYDFSEDGEADADTLSQFTLTSHASTATPSYGRRKRRGDDSSAYSEESISSQRRRLDAANRRSNSRRNQQQNRNNNNANNVAAANRNLRWADNSTRATQSSAPLKPQRSGDFDFMPQYRRAMTTGSTITSGASPGPTMPTMRCQSMCSPPVRPIRTWDDSDPDLKLSPLPRSPAKDTKLSSLKMSDEYDPDMFARLLRGGSLTQLQPLKGRIASLDSSDQNQNGDTAAGITGPPKRPRRISDADFYLKTLHQHMKQQQQEINESSFLNLSSSAPTRNNTAFSSCITSPKPPAKPHRSTEFLEDELEPLQLPPAPATLVTPEAPPDLPPFKPDKETKSLSSDKSGKVPLDSLQEEMEVEDQEEVEHQGQEEVEEDKSKQVTPTEEYDPDLFVRLLHGEARSDSKPVAVSPQSSAEELPSHRHSCCNCDRFGNSAHCTSNEHLEGQMKSSHPPMRPRRSFDETMVAFDNGATLAEAAAAAVIYHAELEDNKKKSICIVGGKRRYSRQIRRSTMPMAQSKSCSTQDSQATQETYDFDPTQEAELTAPERELSEDPLMEDSHYAASTTEEGLQQHQHQHGIAPSISSRRRLTRRFTMPSKCRAASPLSKKPRISRSVSLKCSEGRGGPPAA